MRSQAASLFKGACPPMLRPRASALLQTSLATPIQRHSQRITTFSNASLDTRFPVQSLIGRLSRRSKVQDGLYHMLDRSARKFHTTVSAQMDSTGTGKHDQARMGVAFTCTKCDTRSYKSFSKRSYEHGVVLVRCPGCQSLHLIADNLGWFGDGATNIEAIMAAKGDKVARMSVKNSEGDVSESELGQTLASLPADAVEVSVDDEQDVVEVTRALQQ